jgi:hypothetical protein
MSDKHITGNIGLFWVCYMMSRRGWNVLNTSRNARGVDIVAYNHDGTRRVLISVKSQSKRQSVGMGKKKEHLFADFLIICRDVNDRGTVPECFIVPMDVVKERAQFKKGVRYGKQGDNHWLQPGDFEEFSCEWSRIGNGSAAATHNEEE